MQQDQGRRPCPVALTIAGSDSGGGAGIQADLKTFTTLGVYGMSVITAVTAQNTTAVTGVEVLPVASVTAQIDAAMDDIGCDAAKTGMLATAEIVAAVADGVRRHAIANLVVDPVMISKSGHTLLDEDACDNVRSLLLPLALVVTPNIPEAEALTGISIDSPGDIIAAAEAICSTGCRAAIIKGGHASGDADDHLYIAESGRTITLAGDRIATGNTHGTGCTFSAALAASLACGLSLEHSAYRAKKYVTAAIAHALPLGKGHGPTNHIAAGELLRDGRCTGPER
ncbi:MAG TPA: bifunctional hydroxymethylpyrimidine kinase/phosphomethylpyrimidine kinase [Armatimonadetes bacterium]|jgi:hydroxymethylpyrimidine/phosphomethylpyrimidine kinase|nr:bifunctional hydroxymethylpyrimidine kinase/phosphomethylpyrimidine kinase [Armatimonadota bacterium]